MDPDLIEFALRKFHDDRQERKAEDIPSTKKGGRNKKKSKFESVEEQLEIQKKQQKVYWQKLTKILSPETLSVWKALDKALGKYY